MSKLRRAGVETINALEANGTMPKGYAKRCRELANHEENGMLFFTEDNYKKLAMMFGKYQTRDAPTLSQAASLGKALLTLKKIPEDDPRVAARQEKCNDCDKQKWDAKGAYCKICGCSVSKESSRLVNLTMYEESFNKKGQVIVGCKHPKRKEGKGWPLPRE